MMKQLLLVALLTITAASAQAQQPRTLPVDSARGKVAYSAVVQVPGASQADLYGRALRWLATVVPHTVTEPQVKDAASGTLAARVGLPFTGRAAVGSVQCTLWRELSITVKDGRAKYEISEFEVQPYVVGSVGASPSKAQLRLTPVEEYLNRGNMLYYTKQGQPKAYAASILEAVEQQAAAEVASLRAALSKANDF